MTNKRIAAIRSLRKLGIAEGISFIVLLLIAMPLKYIYGNPVPVKYTGWLHGILFMGYVFMVLRAALILKWSFKRTSLFLAASVLPLATFLLDSNLKNEQCNLSK